MAQATKIEWADVSWNPVHGCSRVSTGCKHCYAETLSLRYGQTSVPWTQRNAAQNVTLKPHKLREPLSKAGPWKSPCRVFVNSMSDLFHEEIPTAYIAEVFAVMAQAAQHTFQVLTKRPERMRGLLRSDGFWGLVADALEESDVDPGDACVMQATHGTTTWLPHVWLGVSIESRKWVDRAGVLRETPAAVRFVSAEPLLGPLLDIRPCEHRDRCRNDSDAGEICMCEAEGGDGRIIHGGLDLEGIDWLIVGGESGPGHRPMDLQWARDLRDACTASGTAFFMKQLGGARSGTALEDLPEDLRIREFPA